MPAAPDPFWPHFWNGLFGMAACLLVACLLSSHRRAIDWRLVVSGLCLQVALAVFALQLPQGRALFHVLGKGVETLLGFAQQGAGFVFGPLVSDKTAMISVFGEAGRFILGFELVATIIVVAALSAMAYHIGLMQLLVRGIAWGVYRLMGASGAEALSNAASVFVGQIEAQLLIQPYLATMTRSELLAVMSGSMACIAGGVMAIYIKLGIPAEFLMAASLMAIPGALVIAKIVLPETEASLTRGGVRLTVQKTSVNLIDAAAHGAVDGLRIGLNVCAVLIAFMALLALIDFGVVKAGHALAEWFFRPGTPAVIWGGLDLRHVSLPTILGVVFSGVARLLGVAAPDAQAVGALMGVKLAANEFVAYSQLAPKIAAHTLAPKSIAIASIALCGFANFGSVAMQIGGIGEMAPSRQHDLARLGLRALACGTLASYMAAALTGILFQSPIPVRGSGAGASGPDWVMPVGIIIVALLGVVLARRLPGPPPVSGDGASA